MLSTRLTPAYRQPLAQTTYAEASLMRCQKELHLARNIDPQASGTCRADPGGAFGVTRKVVVLCRPCRVGPVATRRLCS